MERRKYEMIPLATIPQSAAAAGSIQGASETYQNSSNPEAGEAGSSRGPQRVYNHRDIFRRPYMGGHTNEKFLNPYDGRLCDVVVQSSKGVLDSKPGARWFRKLLQNGNPWMIRLSN